MARTHTAPWEYERTPTPAQLQESDIQYQYCMILNRLERDYGIDRVAEIAKSWGKISYTKKLELVKLLEAELDEIARLKDYCGCVLPEQSCWACNAIAEIEYDPDDEIPFGGE